MKLRKSPRLPEPEYVGPKAYNLTFVTRMRRRHLANTSTVDLCLQALGLACSKYSFVLMAYCFMPDHLHVLATSEQDHSLQDFARHFKQLSAYEFKRRTQEHLWQISYYDHVLRREEAIRPIAEYIWNNPVRAGLAENALDYPFNGPPEYMKEG